MCVICISEKGTRQPDNNLLTSMWFTNPDGAGYMVARNDRVEIHKGFMNLGEFLNAVEKEHFTDDDPVIYHFRISTQAGVNPWMTHPFPLSNRLKHMKALDVKCGIGIVHNGVIKLTSDPTETEYSDTALFITKYLSKLIKKPNDLTDEDTLEIIEKLSNPSRMAFMDAAGNITTTGKFTTAYDGLKFSNMHFDWMNKLRYNFA